MYTIIMYCVSNCVGEIQLHLDIAGMCSTDSTGNTQKYCGFRVYYIYT